MRQINRIPPKMGAAAYQTFAIDAPLSTHWRPATCEEVRCPHHLNGWKTRIDPTTDLGAKQAHYIRKESKRAYHEYHDAGLTTFIFPAGQTCFRPHKIREDRDELFTVYQGDFRARVSAPDRMRAPDWTDRFQEHQYQLSVEQSKG